MKVKIVWVDNPSSMFMLDGKVHQTKYSVWEGTGSVREFCMDKAKYLVPDPEDERTVTFYIHDIIPVTKTGPMKYNPNDFRQERDVKHTLKVEYAAVISNPEAQFYVREKVLEDNSWRTIEML